MWYPVSCVVLNCIDSFLLLSFLQLTTPVVQSYIYLLYLEFLFFVHEIFHGRMTHGGLEIISFFCKTYTSVVSGVIT